MIEFIIAFLVMQNPFALFLYLSPVIQELNDKDFLKVFFKATLITFIIYLIFYCAADFLFTKIFQINFEAFRIFGGIIIFSFAYHYILKGEKALIYMKSNLDDLAAEIALPFMIGAGTISLAMLMSEKLDYVSGIFVLVLVLVLNYGFVVGLKFLRKSLNKENAKIAFDKFMEILLRLMGFFVGAIGVNMIITGLKTLFF